MKPSYITLLSRQSNTTNIYCLLDPITLQPRYIGKADDVAYRFYEGHLKDKSKTHKVSWINSLKSKKLTPIVVLIDEVPLEEWGFWEQHYISLYKSWGFNLTNHSLGGPIGKIKAVELRERAICAIEKTKTGKIFSEKFSTQGKLNKGKIHVFNRKPILRYSLEGELLEEYLSYTLAREKYSGDIAACLKGRQKTASGFIWKYKK